MYKAGIAAYIIGNATNYTKTTLTNCWYLDSTAETAVNSSTTAECCVQTNCGAKTESALKSADFIAAETGDIAGYKADSAANPINNGYPILQWQVAEGGDIPTPSTYTVTFMNGDTVYATDEVAAGGKVTTEAIDTPPVRQSEAQYYDFAGWSSDGGRTVLTAVQVKENVVNEAVTYEAVFKPKEFSVTKDEKQAADDAETASYNMNYNGRIADYAADHDYSVTYTVGDGEAQDATVGTDGSFTIPGASITGNLIITIVDNAQTSEPPMDPMGTYYIISTPEQLAWYAEQTETAGYAVGAYLDAGIDMSDYDWNPMGGGTTNSAATDGYKGTFNGNGHTITIDMSQTSSAPNNSGLFDFIAKEGVVRNVVLAGSVKGGTYVGGIASQNYGTIQNCINKASIAAEASNTVMAGGIVGYNYATIENCANQGKITAESTASMMSTVHAGGIAGKLAFTPNTDPQNSCSISKCYNTGSVSAVSSTTLYLSNAYVGGIAGYYGTPSNAKTVSIEDCYSTGTLNADGVNAGYKYIGGVVGAGFASNKDDSKDYERVTLNRCWYLSGTAEKTINAAETTSGPSDNPCCVETNTGAKTASELKSTSFFTQIEGYKSDSRTNPINGGYPVLQWQTTEGGEDPEPQPAAVWDGTLDFSWYNEDDVQTDYYITTPAQWEALAWICSEHLDKLKDEATYKSYTEGNITKIVGTVPTEQNTFDGVTFHLENDIDMGGVYDEASGTWSGKNYYPIGSQAADDAGTGNFYGEFYGSFDGQDNTVKNVYCDRGTGQNAQAVGLFGRVGERDKDKGDTSPYTEVSGDIVIENVAVTGYIKSGRSVGGIVGKTLHVSDGHKIVIRNCVNYADVASTDSKGVGGIAGALWNSAEIESCINFGDVTFSYSKACAGGIAGDNDGKNVVRDSINLGTIRFTGTIIGNDNSKPEQAVNCYYLEGCITEEDSAADSGVLYYGDEVSEKEAKSSALAEKLGDSYKSSCGEYPVLFWQAAKEHQYGVPVDVPADCVTDAHKESTCSKCGDVSISDVQAGTANGEHDWDNGVCKNCGARLAAEAVVAPAELDLSGTAETAVLKLKAAATTDVKLAGVEFTLSLPEGFSVSKDGITSEALKNITYDATTGRVLCYVTNGENAAVGEFPVEIAILVPAAAAADSYNVGFSNIVFAVYDGDNLSKSALKQGSANAKLTVTVSAQPVVRHKVTFVSNGGSEVDSQDVNNGEKATAPTAPTRAEYTFTGWYTDEACTEAFDFNTPVTTDLTLYAGWKADSTGGGSGGGSGGSGGSGGGSAPSDDKNIEIQNGTGGTVSVSPQDAEKGDEVTITVKPDSGYLADQVKVTDKNGTAIDVTDHGDGTYTFTMPSGKVTVDVTYKTDAAPGSGNFADVARGAWYEEAVNYVVENGYFKGVSDTLFDPDGTMTRAMFATAVGRMAGIDESRYTGSAFSDVPEGQWYSAYVKWASDNGIVNGVGGGMFEPDTKITREQMAAMLYRYAEYAGIDVTPAAGASAAFAAFSDSASVSSYATDSMTWTVGAGIINGRTGTTLVPQGTATRAEVATIIQRFIQKTGK